MEDQTGGPIYNKSQQSRRNQEVKLKIAHFGGSSDPLAFFQHFKPLIGVFIQTSKICKSAI